MAGFNREGFWVRRGVGGIISMVRASDNYNDRSYNWETGEFEAYMSNTDMVDVKRTFPELKLFMNLVEKDRKEAKEEENAEWRRTYEICIERFFR